MSSSVVNPVLQLRCASNTEVCIETKNGETYIGNLLRVDAWMNIVLSKVIRTCSDSGEFWQCREMLIRGDAIKNLRPSDSVFEPSKAAANKARGGGGSGGRGGGGRGRGGGGERGRGRGGARGGGAGRGRGGRGEGGRESNGQKRPRSE